MHACDKQVSPLALSTPSHPPFRSSSELARLQPALSCPAPYINQAETLLTSLLYCSKSMGPNPDFRRPQPCRHRPLRRLLHPSAYSEPTPAQVRHTVRIVTFHVVSFEPSRCTQLPSTLPITTRGCACCATFSYFALLPKHFPQLFPFSRSRRITPRVGSHAAFNAVL